MKKQIHKMLNDVHNELTAAKMPPKLPIQGKPLAEIVNKLHVPLHAELAPVENQVKKGLEEK